MPALADPPSAPAAAPSSTGSAAPPSTGEIHITAPTTDAPVAPAKPGSARDRMIESLGKRGKAGPPEATPAPAKPATPPAPATAPEDTGEEADAPEGQPEATTETPTTPETLTEPELKLGKGKKPSPWKLKEYWQAKATKLEADLIEAKKNSLPADDIKSLQERSKIAEDRRKELEDEIRYVNYQKSEEFKEQYQKPYDKAWELAMSEINEIPVITGEDTVRQATPTDLLELVNTPLATARALANEKFGEFADDVMAHRKELRRLWQVQAQALEDAKTKGAEREKERMSQMELTRNTVTQQVMDSWKSANEEVMAHPENGVFFKPVDGDEDGNARLEKGFAMVDQAFKENPMDHRLTPDQRTAIIKRHAAVRNRAASWGRMKRDLAKERADHAATKKELEQFKSSAPGVEGRAPNGTVPQPSTARERMMAALEARAK